MNKCVPLFVFFKNKANEKNQSYLPIFRACESSQSLHSLRVRGRVHVQSHASHDTACLRDDLCSVEC